MIGELDELITLNLSRNKLLSLPVDLFLFSVIFQQNNTKN
jgi:hypothetical protein